MPLPDLGALMLHLGVTALPAIPMQAISAIKLSQISSGQSYLIMMLMGTVVRQSMRLQHARLLVRQLAVQLTRMRSLQLLPTVVQSIWTGLATQCVTHNWVLSTCLCILVQTETHPALRKPQPRCCHALSKQMQPSRLQLAYTPQPCGRRAMSRCAPGNGRQAQILKGHRFQRRHVVRASIGGWLILLTYAAVSTACHQQQQLRPPSC
jgi:hypothetical protein